VQAGPNFSESCFSGASATGHPDPLSLDLVAELGPINLGMAAELDPINLEIIIFRNIRP